MLPRKGLPMAKLVGLSNRHRHLLIWQKLWPCKPSCYVNLCKGIKTSHALNNEDVMIIFPGHLDIRISLVPSPRCSIRPTNPWTQRHGFGPLSRSSLYYRYHALKQTRLSSPPSSYVAPPASGGIIIVPCCPPIILLIGKNSGRL